MWWLQTVAIAVNVIVFGTLLQTMLAMPKSKRKYFIQALCFFILAVNGITATLSNFVIIAMVLTGLYCLYRHERYEEDVPSV